MSKKTNEKVRRLDGQVESCSTYDSGAKPRRLNLLQLRGLAISSQHGHVKRVDTDRYRVRSQSNQGWYDVFWNGRRWACQCKFSIKNRIACKHIYAVIYTIGRPDDATAQGIPRCPNCKSSDTVTKRGVFKNRSGPVQCYGCKVCGIRFVLRTDFNGARYRASIIVGALDLFFKGLSLRKISDHLNQQYGIRVTHQTVYRWIIKYLALARQRVEGFVPKVSKVWNADETVQNVRGKYCYQWNLIDNKTRFFLATHLSRHRGATDAEKLLEQGILTAHATPRCLVTDGLVSYTAGTSQVKRKRSVRFKHTRSTRLSENNRVERLNNTLRERTKTMRAFSTMRSAQRFADDYRFYYNFIRPHGGLGGQTPAEAAGLKHAARHPNRWFGLLNG